MNEEQRAAFLIAQTACAMIEAMAMASTNQQATVEPGLLPHTGDDFRALIDRYGIGHNAAVTWLLGQ